MFFLKNPTPQWKAESTSLYIPKYAKNVPTITQPFLPNALKIYRKDWSITNPDITTTASTFSTQTIRQIETPNGFFIVKSIPCQNPYIVENSKDIYRDKNSNCSSSVASNSNIGTCNASLTRVRNRNMQNNATNKPQYIPNSYSEYKKRKYLQCTPPTDPKTIVRFQSNHSSSQHTFQLTHECTLAHDCYRPSFKRDTTTLPYKAPFECPNTEIRDIRLSIFVTATAAEIRWIFTNNYIIDIELNGNIIATNIVDTSYFIGQLNPVTSYTIRIYISETKTVLATNSIITPPQQITTINIPQVATSSQSLQPTSVNYNTNILVYVNLESNPKGIDILKGGNLYSRYIPSTTTFLDLSKVTITINYVGDNIYCTDGNNAAYSTDFGKTWTEIGLTLPAEAAHLSTQPYTLKCDYTGKIIYLLSQLNNYSLYYSSDGGKSYKTIFIDLLNDGQVYSYPTIVANADFTVVFMYASSRKTYLSSQIFEISHAITELQSQSLYSLVNINNPADTNVQQTSVDISTGDIYLNGVKDDDFTLVAVAYKD
jgi:hypothetical protein